MRTKLRVRKHRYKSTKRIAEKAAALGIDYTKGMINQIVR